MKRISILFLCMLMMVTCKKDADPVMVKVNYNNVEASASQAVISGSYEYSMEIKSFEILYSEREDMSSSKSVKVYPEGNDFSATLKDLKNGTKYYYQLYFDGEYNSTKLEVMSFTTVAVSAPKVTTNAVTNVTVNSASCGGNVTDDGGAAVTSRGVCWSTNQNPTISGNHTTNGNETGSFTSNITGLSDNTTYYIRAYATNSAGTSYGEQKSFKTLSADNVEDIDLPTVITNMVSDVTETTAVSGGHVTDDGGGTILARGVCWSTNHNPSINDSHTTNGSGTGIFTSQIIGLLGGKTYYVRAYATNEKGTSYGIQKTFKTAEITTPEVTTQNVTSITATSATCHGNVTSDGGAAVTARGFCWSKSQNPSIENSSTVDGSGSGTGIFTATITGLSPNTTYYVRAYANNEKGTSYGIQKMFTTLSDGSIDDVELPTVTTNNVTDIATNSSKCGGNVTDDGGGTVTARGVCWSTSQYPTINGSQSSHTNDGGGTGMFTSNITGLTPNTTYYVRAYATNEKGTNYGEQRSFTTQAEEVNVELPTVTTNNVTDITQTTATSGGNVTDDGGGTILARGVCWGEIQNPNIDNIYCEETYDGNITGAFTSNITNLKANTTYYVRAYATNSAGTGYGEQKSFTTLATTGSINGYDWVDLGLPSGLKWATCNVGASSPEDYGDYFAWGETETKEEYTGENSVTYGLSISQLQSQGYIDGEGNLTSSHDAATANWGGTWRLPTKTELEELLNECTWQWTTQGGKNGYKVTGPNGNHIFLPAAGYRYGSSLSSAGEYGSYWSSTPYESSTDDAYYLYFNSGSHYVNWYYRFDGRSVRPVAE